MKPHEAWMKKARQDLKSAKVLFSGTDPVLDTAVYHTQQCAEKALEAFLDSNNHPVVRTHDLSVLVDLCVEISPVFTNLYDLVEDRKTDIT